MFFAIFFHNQTTLFTANHLCTKKMNDKTDEHVVWYSQQDSIMFVTMNLPKGFSCFIWEGFRTHDAKITIAPAVAKGWIVIWIHIDRVSRYGVIRMNMTSHAIPRVSIGDRFFNHLALQKWSPMRTRGIAWLFIFIVIWQQYANPSHWICLLLNKCRIE